MSTIVVRYRPRPDAADTNQALVEDVPSAPPSTSAVTPTMDPAHIVGSYRVFDSPEPPTRHPNRWVSSAHEPGQPQPSPPSTRPGPGPTTRRQPSPGRSGPHQVRRNATTHGGTSHLRSTSAWSSPSVAEDVARR